MTDRGFLGDTGQDGTTLVTLTQAGVGNPRNSVSLSVTTSLMGVGGNAQIPSGRVKNPAVVF
jgi:hypothetical protein